MARTGPRPRVRKGATVTCPRCGEEKYYPPSKAAQLYCSIPCRDAANRAKVYDDVNMNKKCGMCQCWKSFDEFRPATGTKTARTGVALQSYCVSCSLSTSNEWAKNNDIRRKEINSASRLRNKGRRAEARRNEPEEKRAERNRLHAEWRRANRPKVLMWNRLRTHRLRTAGETPDRFGIGRLVCEQDAKCTYCGVLLSGAYHIDHKTPVSRGGSNDISNLQILCGPCNLKKGTKTDEEYKSIMRVMKTNELEMLAETLGRIYG